MLALQTAGRRCVSLLEDRSPSPTATPATPTACRSPSTTSATWRSSWPPNTTAGQVGFFRSVARAFDTPAFTELERHFDPTWRADRDYVIADMNGSAIFLFAALKMKLNMAIRRQLAANNGRPAPASGPLDDKERAALGPALLTLIEAMGLDQPAVREAALLITTSRAHPQAARRLLDSLRSLR